MNIKQWYDILACPVCKGSLLHRNKEFICLADALAFPIREDIPILLESEARLISLDEKEALKSGKSTAY